MTYNWKEDEILVETGSVLDRLSDAIANGVEWLLDRQDADGFWVGMLESNSCMEAQWILAMHFLGIEDKRKLAGMVLQFSMSSARTVRGRFTTMLRPVISIRPWNVTRRFGRRGIPRSRSPCGALVNGFVHAVD